MKVTPEKMSAFCHVISETCNVGKACKAVDICRQTAYRWREEFPDFAAAWDAAMKIGVTALEDEVHRRGFEGVDKPLVHQGQFSYETEDELDEYGEPVRDDTGGIKRRMKRDAQGNLCVATVKEYSDTLAIFLLKSHDPEKYRERSQIDVNATVDIASTIMAARKRVRGG